MSINSIEAWYNALKNCKDIHDLSHDIGYGFCLGDIEALATLHKKNKYRKKIEALLTDCNFHYECGKFHNREYEEFI